MAWEALKGVAKAVTFVPDSVWASASCEVIKPNGSQAATPAATVSSVSTTLATVTDAQTFTLTSAAGVSQGGYYLVTGDGWTAVAEVSDLTGTSVVLTTALPEAPGVGDAFEGIEITATITAATLDAYGVNWQVRVYKDQNECREIFHVVRHLFNPPCTEAECRQLVNEVWRKGDLQAETYRNVAEAASERVKNRLLGSGRYAHLMGDPDAFKQAGKIAARLELVDLGLSGPGWDPQDYVEYYDERLNVAVGELVQSLSAYDSDEDDAHDDEAEHIRNIRWLL